MKRFLRILINALTVLSMLICLATLVLWVRPADQSDVLFHHSRRALHVLLASPRAAFYIQTCDNPGDNLEWPGGEPLPWLPGWSHVRSGLFNEIGGFSFGATWTGEGFRVGAPHWFICLLTALTPAVCLTARLRCKRRLPGHCPKCGYDLRATPDRCPECGTVAKPAEIAH